MISRGFTILEVLISAAVVGVAVCLLLVVGDRSRRLAGLGESMSNLRQLAAGHAVYAEHHGGRIGQFSWRRSEPPNTQYPDLTTLPTTGGAGFQTTDILRRRTGSDAAQMPPILGWQVEESYSDLVLADFLGADLPFAYSASPGDRRLLEWRTPGSTVPDIDGRSAYFFRYVSSYAMPAAFYSQFDSDDSRLLWGPASGYPAIFLPNSLDFFSDRRFDEVRFPSQKTFLYERFQWFFGNRDLWALFDEARVPHAFADGSVAVRRSVESNLGDDPRRSGTSPPRITYWGPEYLPALPPDMANSRAAFGRFAWTRWGLRGRDFDGPEITSPN